MIFYHHLVDLTTALKCYYSSSSLLHDTHTAVLINTAVLILHCRTIYQNDTHTLILVHKKEKPKRNILMGFNINPIQQNSHQKPARLSAPVNGSIFMGLMPKNSITFDNQSICHVQNIQEAPSPWDH